LFGGVLGRGEHGEEVGMGMGIEREEKTYPDVEVEVLVCYGFYVEAYCRYRRDYFSDLVGRVMLAKYPVVASLQDHAYLQSV